MLQNAASTHTAHMAWNTSFQSSAPRPSPLDALNKEGTRLTVKRGQEIYAEGDDAGYCYKLLSGSVRLVKLMSNGERQICEFLVPGDLMGFEPQDEHYFSSEAVTDAVLIRYTRRAAERLINDDPAAARFVRNLTSSSLQGAYERMVLLCHKSAQERMAWFLLEMAERSKAGNSDCVELPMTRSDIADYLGMVIETVSRVLTQLRQKGVIVMKGVNSIRLVDRNGLEDIASAA
jgi:CRP-like cAMP-binding protein